MKKNNPLLRKAHFLGTKIRNLRKRNNLTMEDLSMRCIQIDAESAPSVSYISMIENGKRVPSEKMLRCIAEIFQKDWQWFLDETREGAQAPVQNNRGGIRGVPLEPDFLFEKVHLQIAIPEMLSQTGTTGRQFTHLLIRAHQEYHQNHFPDLEKAAEDIGEKRMPLRLDEVYDICKQLGLKIKWFDRKADTTTDDAGIKVRTLIRSFFEPPGIIYANEALKKHPQRLKYDLATHIGHCILHGKDGFKTINAAGHGLSETIREDDKGIMESMSLDSEDILHAWRDFECSFFAAALLCPKLPLRQHLNRHAYAINCAQQLDVSSSVVMRRMTAVSSYPHWHYFDAYPGGILKAVYRGNGIPLPWGNMRLVQDPCHHWAVFRMLNPSPKQNSAQISIMYNGTVPHIYCCESTQVKDLAGNQHVLCAGVDLNPALDAQGKDSLEIAERLMHLSRANGGSAAIPAAIRKDLSSVAKILNIEWIARGINQDAMIICPRSSACPRKPQCAGRPDQNIKQMDISKIRQEIIRAY
ncbi:MAG: transcriptional regulator with XRE-family HTH domain/Zn-dependent peptidase ImmA (M78 family) [Lysobacterales bacterium]|jgi:transcriptional regulator with XRE-family HTH domain/Zn-dependent peptidase ImmA (M78 family)